LFPLFVNSVGDTGGKFATGVAETGGCTLTWVYLREFSKKFGITLVLFSGAWGIQKNLKQKIS
jgi:hypothetical protein